MIVIVQFCLRVSSEQELVRGKTFMVPLEIMTLHSVRKLLPPLVPYITVGIGLLVIHNVWAAMIGYHAGMAVIILFSKNRPSLRQLLKSKTYRIPLIMALGGACAGLLLYLLWPFFSVPEGIIDWLGSIGLNEQTWPVFIAYFILVNPVLEEYYWRGMLGADTKRPTINDVLFAGYHLLVLAGQMEAVWLIPVMVVLTAGAWLWRQVNRLNGGLLASAVSHLAADISVILAIYYLTMK